MSAEPRTKSQGEYELLGMRVVENQKDRGCGGWPLASTLDQPGANSQRSDPPTQRPAAE